jgi:hypothetical protein
MRPFAALAILLPGSICLGQPVTIGALPPNPDIVVDAYPGAPAMALSNHPAVATATLKYASFSWSRRPCPAAAKIKFFRDFPGRPLTTQSFAERGPFDVNALTQTVTLSPPVDVQPQDRIAIVRLTACGNPMAQSSVEDGFYVFNGDWGLIFPPTGSIEATPYQGTLSVQATNLPSRPSEPAAILPVVGSTPGAVGAAFFRSAVQLHNRQATPISGRLIYHPQGSSGTAADPSFFYSLQPGETQSIPDLLPAMNSTGLGSLDVIPDSGLSPPLALVRVFNDAGTSGTLGFTEELVFPGDALGPGQSGVLIAPFDPVLFRFNIGIRTLSAGAALTITIRTAAGQVRKTLTRSYEPDYMVQTTAAQFVGEVSSSLDSNESVELEVTAGNAIIYGATVDNRTNDPSLQLAKRVP